MSMKRLNQVLAVEKTVKTKRENEFTAAYQQLGKEALLTGQQRTYKPKFENGVTYPPEPKKVQIIAEEAISGVALALKEIANITALKDVTNCVARADIIVDGEVLLTAVPATHLLWLEKRLLQVAEFIQRLPTLSTEQSWNKDEGTGIYRGETVTTLRTKKVEKVEVTVQATERHPAQTNKVVEDIVEGEWSTTPLSGALPLKRKVELQDRVEKFQRAVKEAREQANATEVVQMATGVIFEKIFAP